MRCCPASNAFEPVDEARQLWLAGRTPAKKLETHDWAAQQWLYFLDGMPAALRKEQLAELDQAFELDAQRQFGRGGPAGSCS